MRWSRSAGPGSHPPRRAARRRAGRHGALATAARRGPVSAFVASPGAPTPPSRPATPIVAARTPARLRSRRSHHSRIAPVALLAPRVAAVVVAKLLPEARLIRRQQLKPTHPLRALPEVEM